jgi:signal transduction histidine kinase/ActR/RegA family two-component response regulator
MGPPATLSEATLNAAFDGAPFGIAVYDVSAEYVCVRHNLGFLKLVGEDHRRRGSIVGVPLRDLFDAASYASVRALWDRVRDTGQPAMVDEFPAVLPPDPEPRYYKFSLTPSLEDGRPVHLVGTAVEVTDLVRARRRAEEDNKRLRFLADAGAALASSLDVDATLGQAARLTVPWFADYCTIDVVSATGQLRRRALAHADPAIEARMRALAASYPDGWEAHHPVGEVLASGRPLVVSHVPATVLEAIDSQQPSFAISRATSVRSYLVCPLLARGQRIGVISFVITEGGAPRTYSAGDVPLGEDFALRAAMAIDNARLHADAEAARVSAESASRSKDEFLAMLGHELRNPLAPILTALELMKMRGQAGPNERSIIERQVRHLSRLVDDRLDVSRIARGKIELERRPVELAALVERALELASPLIEQRHHHLVVDVPRSGLVLDVDAFRLSQVIANLLTNAAKYTPPGGHIWVRGAFEGAEVTVRVRDDGVGITGELLPAIFELFVQGERTLDRASGGLGLGLSLVKNLVSLHGGRVEAHSAGPGHGSEFVVRLPPADPVRIATDAREPEAPPTTRNDGTRILLVDDNEDALELMAEALRQAGHEVVVADDGLKALQLIDTFDLEVGVLDLGMPVMDGFELARRIRERRPARKPLLIAVSGYGQTRDRVLSREAGFDVHFAKPVNLDALLRAIAGPHEASSATGRTEQP